MITGSLPGHVLILEFNRYFYFKYSQDTGTPYQVGYFLKEYKMDINIILN